jgi:dTDP-4-amino-4,6-dideoxygalactose transaminase
LINPLERINVTKAFLPPIEEYQTYVEQIWRNGWLTNDGPLLLELEKKLRTRLDNERVLFVGNGTVALQLAIKVLELSGEIITTPFSYCATTTSILWENCTPIFTDINAHDFNLNAELIEAAITPKTSAILATHVYGRPCDIERIDEIAKKHNLKVIYDGAHAFGTRLNGVPVLNFGDITTCSFHATKVFHTTEGGCVVCNNDEILTKLIQSRSFGHINDNYFRVGINGKNSEFHAAMGLSNLPHLDSIIAHRKKASELYDSSLSWDKLFKPFTKFDNFEYNYAYYPIVFNDEATIMKVIEELNAINIYPRRYFYPALNRLPYLKESQSCPVSEKVAQNVLSLPLSHDTSADTVEQVSKIINVNL